MKLQGKVALITGGASGLGRSTAQLFAEQGARVVIADVDEARGARAVERICGNGGEATFAYTDVSNSASVEAAVAHAESHFGGLNFMVANAGIAGSASRKRLEDVTEAEWLQVMDINLTGVWRCFKAAIPAIRRSGGGAMSATASLAGVAILGDTRCGAYTASKFGVVGLTSYFASELIGEGIRVNCVCPGSMATNILESMGDGDADGERPIVQSLKQEAPTRRLVSDPREVANLHLFLCSDDASFITGQSIVADGGAQLFMRLN